MAIDPATLEGICEAIWAEDDDDRRMAARAAFADLVASDPAGYFEALRIAASVMEKRTRDVLAEVLEALRALDVGWFHRALDLTPSEPAMWDVIRETDRHSEIVDYLGVPAISRAWHQDMRTHDPSSSAPTWLVWDIEAWADEQRHRAILLQLIEDADDDTIWVTAAGPLEDFITDDPVFHRRVVDHDSRIAWVEQHASTNTKFRDALTGVWITGMSAEIAERVDRARNHEQN